MENIPLSIFDNLDDKTDSDWFSSIFGFDANGGDNMLANSLAVSDEPINNTENTSNEITTSSTYISLSNENSTASAISNNESTFINPLSVSFDDEYSVSISTKCNRQHRFYKMYTKKNLNSYLPFSILEYKPNDIY